ncbi:MAG TPA: hypothetical protein DC034_01980, partial [Clostridium sp.]|nr:hypothetical protein [Clostridium sp.]
MRKITFAFLLVSSFIYGQASHYLFVEAESFTDKGGWVVDQQSMDIIGSSYLMAHGLGIPVHDATTTLNVAQKGSYRVWIRTRNWVAPW